MRSRTAASHLPLRVADAEVGRPLRARVRRRDGDERKLGFGRDRLAQIDRAAAADCNDPVARLLRRVGDPFRGHLGPACPRPNSELGLVPAVARDEERLGDAQLREHHGQLADAPADDHAGTRSRANETNARAARVSLRPLERARKISRTGASPRTRAVAMRPASRSASIASREMKAMPGPATTALGTDSSRPTPRWTSRSRSRMLALRNSASL